MAFYLLCKSTTVLVAVTALIVRHRLTGNTNRGTRELIYRGLVQMNAKVVVAMFYEAALITGYPIRMCFLKIAKYALFYNSLIRKLFARE